MVKKDTKLVVLAFVVSVGLLVLSLTYLFLSVPWDTHEYTMGCQEYDGIVREEWQRSDKISNYGDIPKSAKESLSYERRVNLAGTPPRWFSGVEYTGLSDEQQKNIRDSVNNTISVESTIYIHQVFFGEVEDDAATVDSVVFYQEDVYYCYSDRVQMGA
jgi:hypothetical protein